MTAIILHGSLADQFGERFDLAVSSAAEAVRALCCQLRGFRQALRDGDWHVVRVTGEGKVALDIEHLSLGLGSSELHLVPALTGAGSRTMQGIGKALAGVALVAGAFFFAPAGAGLGATLFSAGPLSITYGTVAQLGAALLLGGVSQILAPAPPTNNGKSDKQDSFLFGGTENVNAQGGAVPVVCGRFRSGSVVISAGLQAEEI